MNKLLYFLLFILLSSCSLSSKSSFWTQEKKIDEQKKKTKIYKFSDTKNKSSAEFNKNLKLNINASLSNNSFINNLDNNNGFVNYNGELVKSSKYKFSKIKNFNSFQPDIVIHSKGLIFFDNNGTILNFDNSSKLIWKQNIYTKKEKKQKPILFFSINKKNLIITDNLGKYYALKINDGKLLWKKNHSAPFNSQIKIFKNKFFTVDYESTLHCISVTNGKKLWSVKTEDTFIKSIKKISLIIKNDLVIFNNFLGDISAVDINSGNLVWQTPTQSTKIYADLFKLEISDIVSQSNSIFFSNNKSEFYSLDLQTGFINWKQNINSNLRPTVIENLIFTVTLNGMLVVIEKNSGNVIRITDVFIDFKNRNKIKPVGFIVGKKYIYLTTNNGKLILVNINNGKIFKILKIDSGKISRPLVHNQSLYIAKDDSIIKLK